MKKHGKWLAGMLCFSLLAPSVSWADLDVEKIRRDYEQKGYKLEGVSDEEIASMVERVVDALKSDSSVNETNFDAKLINKSLSVINQYPDIKKSVLGQVTPSDLEDILEGRVPDQFQPIRDAIYSEYRAGVPAPGGSGGGGAGGGMGGGAGGLVQQPADQADMQTGTETAAFAADAFKRQEKSGSIVTIAFDREKLLEAIKEARDPKWISLSATEVSEGETVRIAFDAELLRGILEAHPRTVVRIDTAGALLELPLAAFGGPEGVQGSGVQVEVERKSADQIAQAIGKLADGQLVGSPVSFRLEGFPLNGGDVRGIRLGGENPGIRLRFPVEDGQAEESTLLVWDEASEEWRFVPAAVAKEQGQTFLQTGRFVSGMYAVVRVDASFADIRTHWARKEIEALAKKYLVHGVGPERFQPDAPVTRAQFVSLIARLLSQADAIRPALPWNDVSPDAWYASSLRTAYAAGLVQGEPNGNFVPDKPITREEMAAILVRLLDGLGDEIHPLVPGEAGPAGDANAAGIFPDEREISPWAKEAVQRVVADGLMKGTNRGFEPKKTATRAEAAAVIHRLLQKINWIE